MFSNSHFFTFFFAGERELPVGTFLGDSFSLEKNGVLIFSNKDVHNNNWTLQLQKFQVIFIILILQFICNIHPTQSFN